MKFIPRACACAIAIAILPAAWSAGKKESSEAQQRYKQERAHCLSGKSHQDRETCLREAAAALQEARRGRLESGGNARFEANASVRCNAQPASDREACIQRLGSGATRGSVEGGGLIREAVTPVK